MKRRRTAKEKAADEEGGENATAGNRFSTFINEEEVIKAVHSSVINTAEEVKKETKSSQSKDIQFSKEVLSKITGLIFDIVTTHWTSDLLAFSKHGNRQNCNNDDVLLLARRNATLLASLSKDNPSSADVSPKNRQPKIMKNSDLEDIVLLPTVPTTPFLPTELENHSVSPDFELGGDVVAATPLPQTPSVSGGVTPLAASTPYKGGSLKKFVPGLSCITPIASKAKSKLPELSYIPECEEILEETAPCRNVSPVEIMQFSFSSRHGGSPSPSQISSFEKIQDRNEQLPVENADDSFDIFQETPQKTIFQKSPNDSFENDDFVPSKKTPAKASNRSTSKRSLLAMSSKKEDESTLTASRAAGNPWRNNFAAFSFDTFDGEEAPPKSQIIAKPPSKTVTPFSFSQDSFDDEAVTLKTSKSQSNKRSQSQSRNKRTNIPIADLMNSFVDDDTDFIGLDSLI